MRLFICGIVGLWWVLLAGCSVFVPTGAGLDTAAAAVERASPPEPGTQRIYARKPAPNGALVVYRTLAGQTPFSVGYAYLTQAGMGWQMHESGMRGGSAAPQNGGPILLHIPSPQTPPNRTIVTGLLVDERVRSVRVTFADGQIKIDPVVNGLTGIFLKPKLAVCHLQLLDAQNNELFDFELAKNPPELAQSPDIAEWAQKECK